MKTRVLYVCALTFLVFLFGPLLLGPAHAEELPDECPGMSQSDCDKLKSEYNKLQDEIAGLEKDVAAARAKKGTLQGDVTLLNAQIKQAEAQIKSKNLAITKLGSEISKRTSRIGELESHIGAGLDSLAALIRRQNQVDDLDLVEVALATENAFALFEDVDDMLSVQIGLHKQFAELRGVKAETESERKTLAARQDAELDARAVVETAKQQVARDEAEKKNLLAYATTEEAAYSQVLAERQAQAAAIRARLFPLKDSASIQFGEAVKFAQSTSIKTGVRPAMVLAILSQESGFGTNVGNCLVTDLVTGDGKGKNTGTPFSGVMKAPRDTVPFERITKALGKDWQTTPISCPQPGGYGGAMGPTQFIPSTWELFESRLKSTLGVAATNPWNAEHAIMAMGIYLADVGAAGQTYTAERNAACSYYSGRACPNTGGAVDTYGNSVVAKANAYQREIDFLKDN